MQLPDVPLSARGLEQARRLAARLAGRAVGAILASDLARAATTADILHQTLAAPVVFDPGLRERDYGDVRGAPYADLANDIFGPDYAPPNGETWVAFHARVDEAWRRVCAAAAGTSADLVVVTHGLVCHAIAIRHLDLPAGATVTMRWGNTSLSEIVGPPYREVRVLDCTAHLDRDAAGGPV